jgi:hypothetical protein
VAPVAPVAPVGPHFSCLPCCFSLQFCSFFHATAIVTGSTDTTDTTPITVRTSLVNLTFFMKSLS